MQTDYNILSKKNSLVLRGLAIMAIVLHNFLHNPKLGFSLENEMAFSVERVNHFYGHINNTLLNPYELLSFLGWIGVAVFVFLTGYGVAKIAPPVRYKSPFAIPSGNTSSCWYCYFPHYCSL